MIKCCMQRMHITCLLKCSSCPNSMERHVWVVNGQCSCVQLKFQWGFQVGKINSKTNILWCLSCHTHLVFALKKKKKKIVSNHHLESCKIAWVWWPLPYSLPLSHRVTGCFRWWSLAEKLHNLDSSCFPVELADQA